jgi:hypothetical protein
MPPGGLPAFRSIFVAFVFFCENEFVRRIWCWLSCFCMKTSIKTQTMKTILCLAAGLLALNLMPTFGQPSGALQVIQNSQKRDSAEKVKEAEAALTKFNLDFPGGTPAELVRAIDLRTPKPLNVIIPTEDADTQLPPLKMNDVTTPQLFAALEAASQKTVAVQNGPPGSLNNPNFGSGFGSSYSQMVTGYGFQTSDKPITDTTIWYFRAGKPSLPPVVSTQKICQYYSLSPYLDRGFSVDDITTAIQTGWKMTGLRAGAPELNYHKETKLLIAFGEPDKLKTINQVLDTLPKSNVPIATANEYTAEIQFLQSKIDELNKKLKASSAPPAGAVPAEKSGK